MRSSSRFGEAGFHLAGAIEGARAHDVTVGFDRLGRRKKITLDGREPERMADALGAFPAVIFSPRDAVLVAGAPVERRRFLDVMLALSSRPYLLALQRYRGALARRNAAMRECASRTPRARRVPPCGSPRWRRTARSLFAARRQWADTYAAQYASRCDAIGERGAATMRYASSLDATRGDAEQALLARAREEAPDRREARHHARGPAPRRSRSHARRARAAHVRLGGAAAHGGDRAAAARGGDAARGDARGAAGAAR